MRIIKLHTCEKDTFGSRDAIVDGIVIHTTDTGALARKTVIRTENDFAYMKKIVDRAVKLPGLTQDQADYLLKNHIFIEAEISDALRLCIQAAGLPRKASWHYCIASRTTEFSCNRRFPWSLTSKKCEVDVVEFIDPVVNQAHHVGDIGKRTNRRSIGIECVYPGALSKKLSKNEAIIEYENMRWEAPSLLQGPDKVKRWYAPLSQESIEALEDLCVDLIAKFPIYWIGSHFTFCKDRIDPDPPVDLSILRNNVFAKTNRKLNYKPTGPPKKT